MDYALYLRLLACLHRMMACCGTPLLHSGVAGRAGLTVVDRFDQKAASIPARKEDKSNKIEQQRKEGDCNEMNGTESSVLILRA